MAKSSNDKIREDLEKTIRHALSYGCDDYGNDIAEIDPYMAAENIMDYLKEQKILTDGKDKN